MKEQGEMCRLLLDNMGNVIKFTYSPSGVKDIKTDLLNYDKFICEIINEGWEPFHQSYLPQTFDGEINYSPSIYFRRRVS
jgi:hypothetical protein